MSRNVRNLVWFVVGVVLSVVWVGAYAAMSIEVCGSSTYVCPENDEFDVIGTRTSKVQLKNEGKGINPTPSTNIGVSTQYQGETPAGWSSPTSPPSTAPVRTCWSGASGASAGACDSQSAESAQAAGDLRAPALGYWRGDGPAATDTGGTQGGGQWFGCDVGTSDCWATNNGKRVVNLWKASSCPSGYGNASGGLCSVTNASAVQKPQDNQCTIIRSGNSFTGDPNDPDCGVTGPGGVARADVGNPTAIGNQVNASGSNGKSVKVETATDGTLTVTVNAPDYGSGKTITHTFKYGPPDASGQPTMQGYSRTESQGIGTGNTGSGTGTGGATEGTLQGVKNTLDAMKAKQESDDAGMPSGSGVEAAGKAALDAAAADRQSKLDGVVGAGGKDTTWGWMPDLGMSGSCSPVSMGDWSIDICAQVPRIQSIVAWLWYAFTAFTIIGMVGNTIRRT